MEPTAAKSEKSTAYHEAGHAVGYHYSNLSFKEISIIPNRKKDWRGQVTGIEQKHHYHSFYPSPRFFPCLDQEASEAHAVGSMAGNIAEQILQRPEAATEFEEFELDGGDDYA